MCAWGNADTITLRLAGAESIPGLTPLEQRESLPGQPWSAAAPCSCCSGLSCHPLPSFHGHLLLFWVFPARRMAVLCCVTSGPFRFFGCPILGWLWGPVSPDSPILQLLLHLLGLSRSVRNCPAVTGRVSPRHGAIPSLVCASHGNLIDVHLLCPALRAGRNNNNTHWIFFFLIYFLLMKQSSLGEHRLSCPWCWVSCVGRWSLVPMSWLIAPLV